MEDNQNSLFSNPGAKLKKWIQIDYILYIVLIILATFIVIGKMGKYGFLAAFIFVPCCIILSYLIHLALFAFAEITDNTTKTLETVKRLESNVGVSPETKEKREIENVMKF